LVKVRFYGVLRSLAGEEEAVLESEGTMEDLLRRLCELYPALRDELGFSVVLLNHSAYCDSDPVRGEDEIIIMPALGGG
jgi:molybdopterin converting factor small subunit